MMVAMHVKTQVPKRNEKNRASCAYNHVQPKPSLWPLMSIANNEITRIYYQVVKQSIKRRKLTKLKEASSLWFPRAAACLQKNPPSLTCCSPPVILCKPSCPSNHPPSCLALQPPSWAAMPLASCPCGWFHAWGGPPSPPSSTNVMKRRNGHSPGLPHFKRGLQCIIIFHCFQLLLYYSQFSSSIYSIIFLFQIFKFSHQFVYSFATLSFSPLDRHW